MQISTESTVKEILETYPGAVQVFEKHGVDVPLECDEGIRDQSLDICETMCHIQDLPALIRDLQSYVNSQGGVNAA